MSSKLKIFQSLFLFKLFICYDLILTLYVQKTVTMMWSIKKAIPRQRKRKSNYSKKQYKEMRAQNQNK